MGHSSESGSNGDDQDPEVSGPDNALLDAQAARDPQAEVDRLEAYLLVLGVMEESRVDSDHVTGFLESSARRTYWSAVVLAAFFGIALLVFNRQPMSAGSTVLYELGAALLTGSALGAIWDALDTRGRAERRERELDLLHLLTSVKVSAELLYWRTKLSATPTKE